MKNSKEEFTQLIQSYIKINLQIDSSYYNETNDLFYYILANNFIESILEIAKQDKGKTYVFIFFVFFCNNIFTV